jgi:ABC-type Zn uptake system ZnuABC Zn-binding protein ZnuA
MHSTKICRLFFLPVMLAALQANTSATQQLKTEPLSVAVTEPDIEAIVAVVGGREINTFSLFKGCILRENLMVDPEFKNRLAKAEVIVWTGFLSESAAINASVESSRPASTGQTKAPRWIDVSKSAVRANVPASSCYSPLDLKSVSGDPFFWLNPANGAVIARNVADGLARVCPEKRAYFLANADAFSVVLVKDIARWKEELKPLAHLRIFSAQCGWQNFSKVGGPVFVVCKESLGPLPTPQHLVDRVRQMKAQIIILDPNTPSDYENAFREQPEFRVIQVASSIENIPNARTYNALFDNLVRALQEAAGKL